MTPREARRAELLDAIADHLLEHGLPGSGLRALAAAAGTSDRMLLYYFEDKDEILAGALAHLAARLARLLDAAAPPGRHAPDALLPVLSAALRGPRLSPYMTLWIELAAAAARGRQPHRAAAAGIVGAFLAWAAERLDLPPGPARDAATARLLATVDGIALLAAVGRKDAADSAAAPPG
jgi:AcrR family transcriptional regulator